MLDDSTAPGSLPPTGEQFTIACGDAVATAVELGGGLRSLRAAGRELLDGYEASEQVSSSRGQPLIPWPNRIDGGRYEWDGRTHQLPLAEPARGNAIHGLLRFVRWECQLRRPDRVDLGQLLLPQPGYPFTLAVRVSYRLDATGGLTVVTSARNLGNEALPYASGHHPYLAPPGGALDECVVTLSAGTWLPTDDRGIPGAPRTVIGTPFNLNAGARLAGLRLDTAFGDLERAADGRATVTLRAPDGSGTALWADERYPYLQLFTGDSLAPGRQRRGLAVEPMTAPPNAFATGTDVVRLEPGAVTESSWGISAFDA